MRSSLIRVTCALTLAMGSSFSALAQPADPLLIVNQLWTFNNTNGQAAAAIDRFSSEIGAWDPVSSSLFIAGGRGIEVLGLNGSRLQTFDTISAGLGTVNSISIANGIAAVSFSNATAVQNPGTVQFFNTQLFRSSGGVASSLGSVTVGAVPDMVTWTAGGTRLLVANEGERQSDAINPVGGISSIIYNPLAPSSSTVTNIGFGAWDTREAELRSAGVRIQAGVLASVALEPEYIALSADGNWAQVTLQENNAIATVNLSTNTVTGIRGLGLKDFSLTGNAIDPSDQDGQTQLRNVPVKGLYMPDAIASYSAGGQTFYVMANEGDAFVDDADVGRFSSSAFTLDSTVFTGANSQATLKPNSALGRLNVVRTGATGDGSSTNMSEIVTLGGRSFSIRDFEGNLVYDSGNSLEAAVIAAGGLYADGRSDDKGVEPEGVAVFSFAGRTIAAIGLERTNESVIALYDVTDPGAVSFMQLVRSGSTAAYRVEGITVFEVDGRTYMAMLNEDTGNPLTSGAPANSTILFEISPVPEPGGYAMMGLGLLGLAALARRRRASV